MRIKHANRTWVYSGPGKTRGSLAYTSQSTNGRIKSIELFPAQIITVGTALVMATAIGNIALPQIRIGRHLFRDGAVARTGWIVLCGPLTATPSGMVAEAIHRIGLDDLDDLGFLKPRNRPTPPPKPARQIRSEGIISFVSRNKPGIGKITSFDGAELFCSQKQLRGVRMQEGERVTYIPVKTDRGPNMAAIDIRPAR